MARRFSATITPLVALSRVKHVVLLVALAACEREPAPDKQPPPVKPDPVKEARAEFELISDDYF